MNYPFKWSSICFLIFYQILEVFMKWTWVFSIFTRSKMQNLFGPHPSHLLAFLSFPSSSRFRIWISGSQTLQCPLTPRWSRPPPPSSLHLLSHHIPSLTTPCFIDLPHTLVFATRPPSVSSRHGSVVCFVLFAHLPLFHTAFSLWMIT